MKWYKDPYWTRFLVGSLVGCGGVILGILISRYFL